MQTVRRVYLYFMAAITLTITLVGLVQLLRVLLVIAGINGVTSFEPADHREQVSLAAALIGVGLPVWGFHWYLIERALRAGSAQEQLERSSSLRAFYLSAVLAVALVIAAGNAAQLLASVLRPALGGERIDYLDSAGSIASVLTLAPAWGYHAWVRRRDMRRGVLEGPAAWLPRLYLYGAALVAFLVFASAATALLGHLVDRVMGSAPPFEPRSLGSQLADDLSRIVVGGTVWLGHWWYATRMARNPSWRGITERPSLLRAAYLLSAIVASAIALALLGAAALRGLGIAVLGVTAAMEGGDHPWRDALLALAGMLPWIVAWWAHARWFHRESLAVGPERVTAAGRLEAAGLVAVGLAFGAMGLAWALGVGLDLVLEGDRTSGDLWRPDLATALGLAVPGVTLWAICWPRLQRRHVLNPTVEASSLVRRAYLLIAVAGSIVAGLGSLGVVLYRAFGAVLGVGFGDSAASALSGPLGILVVAAIIGAYHGAALRRDQSLRAESEPAASEAPAPLPQTAFAATRHLVLVVPPGGDMDAVLHNLRQALPTGFRLEVGDQVN